MILEKSCGAVVFAQEGGERLYLVERMAKGHTSICKGHVEGAETERETAAREIWEETALKVAFIDGFRRTIRYSPYEGCLKDVVFFLARADGTETRPQPEGVESLEWLTLPRALTVLTHESDRETLLAADEFLAAHPELDSFRPMRRAERALPRGECEKTLARCSSGVLALRGDLGWPYAVPVSYVCAGGKIYFHGARTGQKPEAARKYPRASFCVTERDDVEPEGFTTRYRSVIAFGRLRELTEDGEKRAALEALAEKYNPGGSPDRRGRYIDAEYADTCVLELEILHMTGKAN